MKYEYAVVHAKINTSFVGYDEMEEFAAHLKQEYYDRYNTADVHIRPVGSDKITSIKKLREEF